MTMLEKLRKQRDNLLEEFNESTPPPTPDQLWVYQELLYRIEVIEVCQMFHRSAPCTTDLQMLCAHYQMVDAYIHHMSIERQYGQPDDTQKQNRQTAANNLQRVIADYQMRFASFRPTTPELYGSEISNVIQSVLIVWIQHRNCYVDINKLLGVSK